MLITQHCSIWYNRHLEYQNAMRKYKRVPDDKMISRLVNTYVSNCGNDNIMGIQKKLNVIIFFIGIK